jgi:hypothetical protein
MFAAVAMAVQVVLTATVTVLHVLVNAETTRSWELVTISTEVVVRQHPGCTDTLSLRDTIAIITALNLVHGAVAD